MPYRSGPAFVAASSNRHSSGSKILRSRRRSAFGFGFFTDALKEADVLVDPREEILTLDEVFGKFYPDQRKWIFDIKAIGKQKQVLNWLDDRIEEGLSRDQVILFGTYDVLQEYKDKGYRLGYTLIWGNYSNRLLVLFTPGAIIDRCETISCDYLVLPIFFASDSLVKSAKKKALTFGFMGATTSRITTIRPNAASLD